MKKNWKKTVSVLLLAALLCALPGTLAWATDIGAITPDNPAGSQTVMEQTGEGQAGGNQTGEGQTDGDQAGGNQTGGDQTGGDQTGGDQTGGDQTGGNQTGGDQTSGNQTGGDQTGGNQTGGDQTGGNQTGGTGSANSTEAGDTAGGSTATDTSTGQSGSGSSTTPEATPTPSPSPTPTPTPTPSLPVITKDPTDETVDVNGDCWFIANCNNALNAVWHFVSPNGKTNYRSNDQAVPTAFPGLIIEIIENGNQSNLHLSSIPAQMNGWGAYCEYSNNNGSVRTSAAVVHVNGASAVTPSPSPSATPTAKPSPSPMPSATPTVAPSPSPSTTQIPVSPTPEGTEEPPAALNRGGKIFLLFGAVALVVGAAAVGTILLVSKRMSAKEAYTYKSSSRRRK